MAPYLDDMTTSEAASRLEPADGPSAGGDELDDIFNYDAGMQDFRVDSPPGPMSEPSKRKGADALGIDEAVEVNKKIRAPKPKLDETRLLSNAGISKLKQRAKALKLKGKGHEYSDATRLLQMYQLWLDDLYPKARFLDGLKMIEKIGHTRRIQSARMDWINEGKPKDLIVEEGISGQRNEAQHNERQQIIKELVPFFRNPATDLPKSRPRIAGSTDEIYDATPMALRTAPAGTSVEPISIFGPARVVQDDEPEDDLDALLAEAEMEGISATVPSKVGSSGLEPDFDDEMEAMAEMEGW